MANREYPAPAGPDAVRRLKVWTPDEISSGGQYTMRVPPWGYLEGFDIRMRELVPNMDAAVPLMLALSVHTPIGGGVPIPLDVAAVVRDVLDYGATAPDPYTTAPRPGDTILACPSCGETLRGHLELIHRRSA